MHFVEVMKAMILSAGLGTRLKPLTDLKPKALIEVNGVTLLELIIKRLTYFGAKEIIINTHYFEEQILDFLNKKKFFTSPLAGLSRLEVSSEKEFLLDTGGGIKNASWFFDDGKPFLVQNVDVLSDINLNKMYEEHIKSEALATLAVRERPSERYFLFNEEGMLCGWKNAKTGEIKIVNKSPSQPPIRRFTQSPIRKRRWGETEQGEERISNKLYPLAFSGIHIISPQIFGLITEQGRFSITDVYLRLAKDYKIIAFLHNETKWLDIGNKENLENAVSILGKDFFE